MTNIWVVHVGPDNKLYYTLKLEGDGVMRVDKSDNGEWFWEAVDPVAAQKMAGSHFFNSPEEALIDAEMWRRDR